MECKVTNVKLVEVDVNLSCLDYYQVKVSKNHDIETQSLFGSVSKQACLEFMKNYVAKGELPLDFTLYLVQKSTIILKSIYTELNEKR